MNNDAMGHVMDEVRALEAAQKRIGKRIANLKVAVQELQVTNRPTVNAQHIRDLVWVILNEAGPLHRKEIFRRVVETGASIPGEDPLKNLGAHMSLDERLVPAGHGVWELARLAP